MTSVWLSDGFCAVFTLGIIIFQQNLLDYHDVFAKLWLFSMLSKIYKVSGIWSTVSMLYLHVLGKFGKTPFNFSDQRNLCIINEVTDI